MKHILLAALLLTARKSLFRVPSRVGPGRGAETNAVAGEAAHEWAITGGATTSPRRKIKNILCPLIHGSRLTT